jgi:hypothetical protein
MKQTTFPLEARLLTVLCINAIVLFRQWSERYFVLTPSALHYFKKEKTQLFGEERGHFLVEDMMVRPLPDKRCFEIFCNEKSRILKAPTDREYLAWAKAFQDVQIKHQKHLRTNYQKVNSTNNSVNNTELNTSNDKPSSAKQHRDKTSRDDKNANISSGRADKFTANNGDRLQKDKQSTPNYNNNATNGEIRQRRAVRSGSPASDASKSSLLKPLSTPQPSSSPGNSPSIGLSNSARANEATPSPNSHSADLNTEPLLLVTVEGASSSSSSDAVGWLGGPAGRGAEIIAGRGVQWNYQLLIPGFSSGSTIVATLADGSKVRVEREEFKTHQGEKSITVHDPYRPMNVRVRWNCVSTPIPPAAKTRLLLQIIAPAIFLLFIPYLLYFHRQSFNFPLLAVLLAGLVSSIQVFQAAAKKFSTLRAKTLWFVTFVSCSESGTAQKQPNLDDFDAVSAQKQPNSRWNRENLISNSARNSGSSNRISVDSASNTSNSDSDDSERDFKLEERAKRGKRSSGRENGKSAANLPLSNSLTDLSKPAMVKSSSVPMNSAKLLTRSLRDKGNNYSAEVSTQSPVDSLPSSVNAEDNSSLEISNNSAFDTENEWPAENNSNPAEIQYEDEKTTLENHKQNILPPLREAPWGHWTADDLSQIKIRGPNFMDDKLKIPCGPPLYKLVHVDMFHTAKERIYHIASQPHSYAYIRYEQKHGKLKRTPSGNAATASETNLNVPSSSANSTPLLSPAVTGSSTAQLLSPLIIVNFLFPGPGDNNYNLVLYFQRRVRPAELMMKESLSGGISNSNNNGDSSIDINRVAAFDRVLSQFLSDGNDDFRDSRFKIIPRIAKGNWVVQKGVGCTPAILGRKIKQSYHRDETKNYLEIDADVGSSLIAGRILALVKGAATSLTIDLSFLLQGESIDELPESMLGGVRLVKPDLGKILHLDENKTKNNMIIV